MDGLTASPSLTENDIQRDTNPFWILCKNVRFRAFEKSILPKLSNAYPTIQITVFLDDDKYIRFRSRILLAYDSLLQAE